MVTMESVKGCTKALVQVGPLYTQGVHEPWLLRGDKCAVALDAKVGDKNQMIQAKQIQDI